MVLVSADLDRSLVVTPAGGAPIELGHTGFLSATKVDDELSGAALEVAFPDLIAAGSSSLEVQLDAEAHGTGEMRQGDQVLAAITGPFAFDAPLAFSWCP